MHKISFDSGSLSLLAMKTSHNWHNNLPKLVKPCAPRCPRLDHIYFFSSSHYFDNVVCSDELEYNLFHPPILTKCLTMLFVQMSWSGARETSLLLQNLLTGPPYQRYLFLGGGVFLILEPNQRSQTSPSSPL